MSEPKHGEAFLITDVLPDGDGCYIRVSNEFSGGCIKVSAEQARRLADILGVAHAIPDLIGHQVAAYTDSRNVWVAIGDAAERERVELDTLKSRDITEFMVQAEAADPEGTRAREIAADIEFALGAQDPKGEVPMLGPGYTLRDIARVEQALGVRIKVVSAEPACPDCGDKLSTGWGWCEGCGGWREI